MLTKLKGPRHASTIDTAVRHRRRNRLTMSGTNSTATATVMAKIDNSSHGEGRRPPEPRKIGGSTATIHKQSALIRGSLPKELQRGHS